MTSDLAPRYGDQASTSARALIATGAVCGIAWAASLRGWMIQMADDESAFHWYSTLALVLAPGAIIGALIGLAEYRRRTGGARSRWLILAPCLFLVALTDPTIITALFNDGTGGGALGVVLVGLAGGYALSGRGSAWWRRSCGAIAVLGVLLMLTMASDTAPLGDPRGTWIGVYAASLLAVLCLACAIPQRIGRPTMAPARWMAVGAGALCGVAWAAALRAFMWEVAGPDAGVEWAGTFVWVLLPGAVIGALLGWAEHRRWSGPVPCRRWLIWAPMLFAAVLLQDPRDLVDGFEGGIGLAAVAVPAICMAGGYGLAGRGPAWLRVIGILVLVGTVPAWALSASDVGGPSMGLDNPHGAWAAVLYWALLATFSLAASIPHRRAVVSGPLPAPMPEPMSRSSSASL
jgi:hypothetical protein